MERPSLQNPEFKDLQSPSGKIRVRSECIGEVVMWAEGYFWHLNRSFEGRSIFFGIGINAYFDPEDRFLVLRDGGTILLFDYRDGRAWHVRSPWFDKGLLTASYPSVGFEEKGVSFQWTAFAHQDKLHESFSPGLGESENGFLSGCRGLARDSEYIERLNVDSAILENLKR
jgi:hypothetical protein